MYNNFINKEGVAMKMRIIRRAYITLIEMMIVMFLIALITGVIAYNVKGSLDQGKVFKTKVGMEKVETILNLAIANDPDLGSHIKENWKAVVKTSPLVQNPDSLIKDGWGNDYDVNYDDGKVTVRSEAYEKYTGSGKGR
jgi:hypothetical protein